MAQQERQELEFSPIQEDGQYDDQGYINAQQMQPVG